MKKEHSRDRIAPAEPLIIIPPAPEKLAEALRIQIKSSSLYAPLRMYCLGSDLDNIAKTLLEDYSLSFRLSPHMINVFRAFKETDFSKVKVVIYTSQMNPGILRYTGIVYSQDMTNAPDSALKEINRELARTIPDSKPKISLLDWCHQGVLLLPNALTTILGQEGAHVELWKNFNNTLFDLFRHNLADAIYVLIGEGTWARSYDLHKDSVVIKADVTNCNFPAIWGEDVFARANTELKFKGRTPINW